MVQAKLEQAKLAAKVMNVATPGSSFAAGSAGELKSSNTQTELKAMQKGLGECVFQLSSVSAQGEGGSLGR